MSDYFRGKVNVTSVPSSIKSAMHAVLSGWWTAPCAGLPGVYLNVIMEGSVAVECDGLIESELNKKDGQRHGATQNHLTRGWRGEVTRGETFSEEKCCQGEAMKLLRCSEISNVLLCGCLHGPSSCFYCALFTPKMHFGFEEDTYPLTPGVLIRLFCPLSTTVLISFRGGSMDRPYGLFQIF